MALGLRGVPDGPGGVEPPAAELSPRLARLGAAVPVLGRSRYRSADVGTTWQGVRLTWLWSPRLQGAEALVHTLIGVFYAAVARPDILHIHAVGPWLVTPLARLAGLRVVVTHHGQDYLREKWSSGAQALL